MKRKCASVLLILGLLNPGIAAALGLGELTLKSFLNEPLVAEVKLLEIGDLDPSQIRVRLATREDFSRAGVERAYFLTSLRFEVVGTPAGGAVLQIRSTDPVREPYLDFIVEARWPTGRLLREYTVLLDPPIFAGDESGIAARASATQRPPSSPRGSRSSTPSPARGATAPAPQPPASQRQYDAQVTDRPASGEQYLVQRSDTLWKIAAAGRPSGASVQQTMLDIQRLNPEAFIGGNINQLKAGYVLRLPTAGDITPQSFEEAVREVERQTQRWQSGVSDVDRLDASEGLDVSGVSGSDSGEGHLQIAGVDASDEMPGSGDVSARMEDLDRARRENVELGTRLSAMEEQMEMQERLISLKDEQIAALQDALERAGGDVEDMPAGQEGTIEALEPAEPVAAEPEQPAAAEPEQLAAEPEPQPVQPTPRPAPAPAPTMLDRVMDNIMYVGAGLLALVLLVLYLLRNKLGGSVPKLGRKKDQEMPVAAAAVGGGGEDDFADVSLSEDSLLVDEFDEEEVGGQEVEAPAPTGSSYSAPDEQAYAAQFESGDALAEADIYIAYGRFPQAVDLLKAAIAVEPTNTDYRIKLMEACVEMVESGEFQQQYADLQVIGDENVLQRARSLLEAVDGGEVWLDDLPDPTITAAEVEAARASSVASATPVAGIDAGLEESVDLGLDADLDDLTADDSDDAGLDFDVSEIGDLDGDTDELGLDIDDEAAGLELDDDSSMDLDLDVDEDKTVVVNDGLGLDLDEDKTVIRNDGPGLDLDSAEAPSSEDELAGDSLELDELGLGDDLTMDLADEAVEAPAADASAELDELSLDTADDAGELSDIDLPDLELDGLDAEPAAASGDDALLEDLGELGADLEEGDSDLESMSLSLDDDDSDLSDMAGGLEDDQPLIQDDAEEPDLGASDLDIGSELDGVELDLLGEDNESDADLADLELDMGSDESEDDGLVFAADGDEIATKLDLARAYIDMGDHDGARSILEEVMEGGSGAQQGEARELLEGID